MRIIPLGIFLVSLLFTGGAAAAPRPLLRLANEHVEVSVDPTHGLILRFGIPGHRNLFWENADPIADPEVNGGWVDYGGDKLWWGPMVDWQRVKGRRFPPDEALDAAWTVIALSRDRVVMRSTVSPWVGIYAEREISLSPTEPTVVIHNRFTRVTANPQRLQLWTICQLPRPAWCWLDSQPRDGEPAFVNLRPSLDPEPFTELDAVLDAVRYTPVGDARNLIGTRGDWIAAVYDDVIVAHSLSPYPDGEYAENCSLQLFVGPDYIEIETLSGLATPMVGESMTNTVRWHVFPRPASLAEIDLGHWLRTQLDAQPQ